MSRDPWLTAALAWGVLLLFIFLYVLGYDLWAHYSQHRTMTNQFVQWLRGPVSGPIIGGVYVGLFAGLTIHFLFTLFHVSK